MALRRDEHGSEDDRARTEPTLRVEHLRDVPVPAPGVNVGLGAAVNDVVVVVTRVVLLAFTVLETLLLLRFALKLAGANAQQPLVLWLYAFTEALVRPFQGIFPEPRAGTVIDVAALLAIVFLFLVSWLIVALVRAIAGRAY